MSIEKVNRVRMRKLVPLLVLLSLLVLMITACSSKLPKQATAALEEYTNGSYSVVDFQKAKYPENFVFGIGLYRDGVDEAWCVVYNTPEYGTNSMIITRLGASWDTFRLYRMNFEVLGCTNYQ